MWPTWRRDVLAAAGVAFLGWLGLPGRVPLLAGVDLGFHELGHLVCYVLDALLPWPQVITAAAGSIAQVVIPLGLAGYFGATRRERHAAALCLAWAGTSAADVARYIADAPYEALPLIGGSHDWATILGGEHLDRLDLARGLATATRSTGIAFVIAAVAVALLPLMRLAWTGSDSVGVARAPRTSSGPRI